MTAETQPSDDDVWFSHLLLAVENCPDKKQMCGAWFYKFTKSQKRDDEIDGSGRLLSLIDDGIASYAETCAAKLKNGRFFAIVVAQVSEMKQRLAPDYQFHYDPFPEDRAHAYIRHEGYHAGNRADFNISEEVLRLHEAVTYVAADAPEMASYEKMVTKKLSGA